MMVKVKDHRLTLTVRSHFTSFSPFNAAPFNGPFFCFYSKHCVYEKRTEWVVNPFMLNKKQAVLILIKRAKRCYV